MGMSVERVRATKRFGALALLLVGCWLLCQGREWHVPPASRSPGGTSVARPRDFTGTPSNMAALNPDKGLWVRTCDEGVVLLAGRVPGAIDAASPPVLLDHACVPSDDPKTCGFLNLPPGDYRVAQGPFLERAVVREDGFGSVDLGCQLGCTFRVQVAASDRCATAGTLTLATIGLVTTGSVLVTTTWNDGEVVVARGLPCTDLVATGEGGTCTPSSRGANPWTPVTPVILRTLPIVLVRVLDAESRRPVPGAHIGWRGRDGTTNIVGEAEISVELEEFQVSVITAEGYAGVDVLRDDIVWDSPGKGTVVVELHSVHEHRVRCIRGAQSCEEGTTVKVSGGRLGGRPRACWVADGEHWTCLAAAGDRVTARYGQVESTPVQIDLAESETVVSLPDATHSVCLDLGQSVGCSVVVEPGGAAHPVRSGGRVFWRKELSQVLLGVVCDEGAWHDLVGQVPDEGCVLVDVEAYGSICVAGPKRCEVSATLPRWQGWFVGSSLSPCRERLPAGLYTVSCVGEPPRAIELRPGEDLWLDDVPANVP